jgi:hypothetical protein
MARVAVARSAGQCESFRGNAGRDFLAYLDERSPALRSIHITSWIYMMPPRDFVQGVMLGNSGKPVTLETSGVMKFVK